MSRDSWKKYFILAGIVLSVAFGVALYTNNLLLPQAKVLPEADTQHFSSTSESQPLNTARLDRSPALSSNSRLLSSMPPQLETKISHLERDYQLPQDLRKFIEPSASAVMRKELRLNIYSHLNERLSVSDLRILAQEVGFSSSSLELLERVYLKQNYTIPAQDIGQILSRFESSSLEQIVRQSLAPQGTSGDGSQVLEVDSDLRLINELSNDFFFSLAHFISTKYLAL